MNGQGKNMLLFEWFIDSNILWYFQGKLFFNNGDRYEGEFKEGEMNGQGKNMLFIEWLIDSNII